MSQINPKDVIKNGWFIPGDNFDEKIQIQQIGIDVTYKAPGGQTRLLIPKGQFRNIEINEGVQLPDSVYADMKQRSSFSRRGIFITCGFYDPGFKGTCGLSIYNLSGEDIYIDKNERLAQMVFYEANSASSYDGTYNHQTSIKSKYV